MQNNSAGFTLLELLIAMAIFSLISVMSFSGLSSVLNNKEGIDRELQLLSDIQRTMLNLSRDIEQTINRPVNDGLGGTIAALTGGNNIDSTLFELSRTGWRNPAEQHRSQLQRVAYSFEDHQLIRLYWYHIDRTQTAEPVRRVLLNDVNDIKVRYLDQDWSDSWPNTLTDPATVASALPRAIEITLTLKRWGPVTRLFRLPR
ncbi:MAG: type II secretion system minor pseudopilin GspJ [Gammaproteobacteria bacterium]|nr:type II secretion system minor pseudopilin GspJ [Gammaproteobacteria bacterium]